MAASTEIGFCRAYRCFGFSNQNGFSLIEVVVAMAVLAIGLLAVMRMENISQRNITSGNIVTIATLLAHTEIEKIKAARDVSTLKQTFFLDPDLKDPFRITYHFSDPLADTVAKPLYANCGTARFDGSGACRATVTVSWKRGGGGRGGAGSVSMQTMVYGGWS